MKIIEPRVEVDKIDPSFIIKCLEFRGRRCYKSEEKITGLSAPLFVKGLVDRGHTSVIEHEKISVNFVIDRGVSHELVRHRI
ncbi:MAG: FAD-dependent thymidylate synthase, partial [Carboxydocellales bacterium]